MTRNEAINLLHKYMKSVNLRRHCYAVDAVMGALYDRFEDGDKSEEKKLEWQIAGLLHDSDYEITRNDTQSHTKKVIEWLKDTDASSDIRDAISSHAWGFVEGIEEPKTKIGWALYCCDELTGLIVAVALVKPDKSLASVTVDSILNKWNSKSFAAGVNRKQIEECKSRLGIELPEFIDISLRAMQNIHQDLGL